MKEPNKHQHVRHVKIVSNTNTCMIAARKLNVFVKGSFARGHFRRSRRVDLQFSECHCSCVFYGV